MKKKIVVASKNKGKIEAIKKILYDFEIVSMSELKIELDVEENKETPEENAIKKAEEIAKLLDNEMCLADDSGIFIETLNGFPGVKTKRWFDGTDRERNLAIIEKLKGFPKEDRKVKFITAMAISNGEKTICAEEDIEGYITEEPRGNNGFGFDEIFELESGKTLAELTPEEKIEIGTRKKILEKLKNMLKDFEE